jgi:hypothetical protein
LLSFIDEWSDGGERAEGMAVANKKPKNPADEAGFSIEY